LPPPPPPLFRGQYLAPTVIFLLFFFFFFCPFCVSGALSFCNRFPSSPLASTFFFFHLALPPVQHPSGSRWMCSLISSPTQALFFSLILKITPLLPSEGFSFPPFLKPDPAFLSFRFHLCLPLRGFSPPSFQPLSFFLCSDPFLTPPDPPSEGFFYSHFPFKSFFQPNSRRLPSSSLDYVLSSPLFFFPLSRF